MIRTKSLPKINFTPGIMKQAETLIVGAGISGLATAATLQKKGIGYIIIEREAQTVTPWRNHYDRLHLHTNKGLSTLPYKKFGKTIPRYPSRSQLIDYLDGYQTEFNIQPLFNTEARSVRRESDHWITQTSVGEFMSRWLVMAAGIYSKPKSMQFNGMETFPGKILHSSVYKTGREFKGENVLVVGFGNSACEIAIDLYEQGAMPFMSVRSPVNVIPRDIFGIPILELSLLLNRLSPRMADIISAPLIRLLTGDITRLGLKKMPYGPLEEIHRDANAPVLDIGTLRHIRQGHIKVYDDIDFIGGRMVHFKNGAKKEFDAIVAAIGFDRHIPDIVHLHPHRLEDLRVSTDRQQYFGEDGLYFCGYWVSPTGQIREIASDAKKIASDIAKKKIQAGNYNKV
jgi:indole-3-pyruvate monooxygenase